MQDIIRANREATQDQLRKEGKTMGMFATAPAPAAPVKKAKKAKKKKDDFEEVFDHLEEPEFDPEEMQHTAMLLRQRQQDSLAMR